MVDWHVVVCRPGHALRGAEAVARLPCVSEIYAPLRMTEKNRWSQQSQLWLGVLVLARWPGDDPHAWHDVAGATAIGRPLTPVVSAILGGWPPATVPDAAVERFARAIQVIESKGQVIDLSPPCAAGDAVRFTHLGGAFYEVLGHCLWASAGVVGIRVRMMGHDQVIQVPYAGVVGVERVTARQYGRRR